jgi:hypothetical protein
MNAIKIIKKEGAIGKKSGREERSRPLKNVLKKGLVRTA